MLRHSPPWEHSARVVLSFALLSLLGAVSPSPASGQSPPLNFVVVISDDQPFPTIDDGAMPNLDAWAQQGIRFERAYVSYPVCAPTRASFLSGGFEARETGVTWNSLPQGGVLRFDDTTSLGTRFQAAGYATAHIGKYINAYKEIQGRVPPGWTLFVEHRDVGSSDEDPSETTYLPLRNPHLIYHYRDYALDFIDAHAQDPFLLVLAADEPHYPARPAPGDESLFPSFLYRPPSYLEPDIGDKPSLIQLLAPNLCCHPEFPTAAAADEFHRDQLRSLVGLDRVIETIRQRLQDHGVIGRTVFFFFSDNGLLRGEHQTWSKDWAYEESLGVPMIAIGPGMLPRSDSRLVVANLDIPATLYDLGGIEADTDGRSLAPRFADPQAAGRAHVAADFAYRPRYWAALVTEDWKYVEWGNGEVELYDLVNDPYEMESVHADPAHAAIRQDLATLRASEPRTLSFTAPWYRNLPPATVGQPYSHAPPVWGGTPPYTFRIESGSLPLGIQLDPATGTLSGVPQLPETYAENIFYLEVTDSSVTRHHGGPQLAVKDLSFRIVPEPGSLESLLPCIALLLGLMRREGA